MHFLSFCVLHKKKQKNKKTATTADSTAAQPPSSAAVTTAIARKAIELKKRGKSMASRSPCAACKCLRRKCTVECVFAPYFPADNPQMFINVHKVFGASNVAKLLYECITIQERVDVVNSLAYEAECRLRDPVYGSIGIISALQHRLNHVRYQLEMAKKELASYVGEEMTEQIRFMEFNQMAAPAVPQSSVVIPYLPTPSQELYSPAQLNPPPPPPNTDVGPSSS